ncbi:hypothetical protein ACFVIX_18860, partial [Bacillus subtilis]
ALFLHLKPDEYLKKLYKTKKLVEKTSFSLQADRTWRHVRFFAIENLKIKPMKKEEEIDRKQENDETIVFKHLSFGQLFGSCGLR